MSEPPGTPQTLTNVRGEADVHAFLIADVRGYTAFTQERGDEDAARLAGRFAEVTRGVVEDHRGRVLELRGDEALVVFGSPRSAIRGAVALQQRFVEETIADPSLPLTVGIGLDAGEAVPVEGGYRGGALNVAARLCSLARAGEVLASREIVHLALRVDGVRFIERGPAEMKGLDKPVHVVAVRSEDRDDAEAIAPFVRSIAPAPAPRRRWKAAAGAVAFALLVAVIAIPLARRGGGSSEIEPNSIGALDPETGEVIATVGLEASPGSVAASADTLWVTNPDAGTVTRIDPIEQAVVDTIPVGENPTGIAVGEDDVWIVESGGPSVSRISAETSDVVDTIPVGNGPAGIAVGEGSVWVTNRFDGTVSRIDPVLDEVVEEIRVGLDPRGIAVGFGSVWVALAGSNAVVRVDPATNEVAPPIGVGNAPGSLAVDADGVWVANTLDDTVMRISPETNSVVGTTPVGDDPSGIAVVDGIVWVANEADATLSRIESGETPGQTSVRAMVVRSVPQGLAGVNGDLWVSVRGTATSHQGGTLRLVSSGGPDDLDPATAYSDAQWLVLHLLGDGLVAFKQVGGSDGATLVPDLAITLPTPTDVGRTYTFQVREGIRYSNGQVVVPSDFRRAFERGFGLEGAGNYEYFFSGVVGADSCLVTPQTCDLSGGIVTDDASGTIAFHLVSPDPEFLAKLALPFAYPIPPGTPAEHLASGVPGTGPYRLEGALTDQGVTLVRNGNFRPWSPAAQPDGNVDRIEWRFGVEEDAQVEAVAAGDADVTLEAAHSSRFEEILVRFAGQVHTTPWPSTWFLMLNTRVPPFDDVDVRRALNFAIDRNEIVGTFGGDAAATATCQQIPPNFPGYEPYCPYSIDPGPEGVWTAPDPQTAAQLVRDSGTRGMRVTVWFGFGPPDLPAYIVELLEGLGYRAQARKIPRDSFPTVVYDSGNELQMVIGGWFADYPAASNFIVSQFTCDWFVPNDPLQNGNVSGFCDPEIDVMVGRAVRLQAQDPIAANQLWAEIDRAIVDEAPYVWLVNDIAIDFVSDRFENYQRNPQWGVLLSQAWVR